MGFDLSWIFLTLCIPIILQSYENSWRFLNIYKIEILKLHLDNAPKDELEKF